jgi:hypothetical protein
MDDVVLDERAIDNGSINPVNRKEQRLPPFFEFAHSWRSSGALGFGWS